MRPWPEIREVAPSHVQREFRGVNKLDPFSINDNSATDMSNIISDDYPTIKTRSGFSLVGTAFGSKILGLNSWKNTELHTVVNGSWYRFTGGSWNSVGSGLNASAEWSFTNFKGSLSDINLIGANGVDPVKTYGGSTVSNLSGAPANANYIITYDNRLFCAVANDIKASELNVPTNWTTTIDADSDPYTLRLNTQDGETINCLIPGIGHVTVFKPNSMHEIYGSAVSDVRIEAITFEVGVLNKKCAVTLNGIMFLLHRTGIYRYGGGTRPSKDFSEPVQYYVDRMNASATSLATVGTDGHKLYFSIPINSSTVPDTILVYDPEFDYWAVWNGFTTLHIANTTTDTYMGMNDGRVIKLGGTSDNGTPIAWNYVSKPFGAQSLNKLIRWFRIWIVCDVPTGSSLNVHVSPSASGNDWVQIGSATATGAIQSKRLIFTPSQLANANWIRIRFSGTGPVKIYEFDRDQREFPLV